WLLCSFFFFQAEDGIRDFHVTGVQTCALPISAEAKGGARVGLRGLWPRATAHLCRAEPRIGLAGLAPRLNPFCRWQLVAERRLEIGRASCRERGEMSGDAV